MNKELVTVAMLTMACETATPPGPVTTTEYKESLHSFTMRLIDDRASTLPPYKKELIAANIERVANRILADEESRRTFATLVAVESGFNERAVSSAKAVGLSQVLPHYSKEFMKACGIEGFDPKDLDSMELNLTAGACAFKKLLELNGGNTAAALVSYNSGISSISFKNFIKGFTITNVETANYPAKILYLKEKTELAQEGTVSRRSLEKSAEKREAKPKTDIGGH